MKLGSLNILLIISVLSLSPIALNARIWTMADGKTFEAEIVNYRGGIVILKKATGGRVLYSVKQLSSEDQAYVREKFPGGDKLLAPAPKPKTAYNPPVQKKTAARTQVAQALPTKVPPPRLLHYKPGDIAPNVGGKIQGSTDSISLKQLRGKLVLVDFWATWCPPCRKEMPQLVQIYNRYKDRGFEIIGVSLDQSKINLSKFENQYGITWPMALDKYKTISKKWGVETIPTMVLISQNGIIIADHLRTSSLELYIRKYLRL